jgi:hypothetical protein
LKALLLVMIAATGACLRDTEFHCMADSQCGSNGTCDLASTFCTVPDTNCVLGRRYAEFSGALTNHCVVPGDGGVDAGNTCGPNFSPLSGAPGHLYHLFTVASDFTTQRNACSVQGGVTYLAIPDEIPELQAILALAAQPTIWVGIDDQVTEGNYLTVRGQPAPFLPWASGQPNNSGGGSGEDCVAALSDGTYDDQNCSNALPAVCECEP